jgi:galactokinase
MDFLNDKDPYYEKMEYDFNDQNYDLIIVNTGGNHSDLSEEYSSIPLEMKEVAKILGGNVLRDVSLDTVLKNSTLIRQKAGDRAILRAIHFFEENQRVADQVEALKKNDFKTFLELITESGNSSWKKLQNCYCSNNCKEQNISYYLALTEIFIKEKKQGACRVHGGGFAGVIAVYLPKTLTEEYSKYIESITKIQSIYLMTIRKYGVVSFENLMNGILGG